MKLPDVCPRFEAFMGDNHFYLSGGTVLGSWSGAMYRVFQKFVDILKSLYFIQISYISLHFLADINKSYCLSIFRTFV